MRGPFGEGVPTFKAPFKGSESLKDDDAEGHFHAGSASTKDVQALRSA